ncbi:hypothetical protein AC578_6705 [Pseudocercospora eumusae]|uniref:Uncharacterized protein n=1 Tax=Pseudocercospora eumusae TaxID=321146 RepID=A0A139HI50_9PEZI|nr:hypothetical protein AC578_6705 [Pseudocercospora eumusae]
MAGAYLIGCHPGGSACYWQFRELAKMMSDDDNYQWRPEDLLTSAAVIIIAYKRCAKSLATRVLYERAANRACGKCTRLHKGACETLGPEWQGRIDRVRQLYEQYRAVIEELLGSEAFFMLHSMETRVKTAEVTDAFDHAVGLFQGLQSKIWHLVRQSTDSATHFPGSNSRSQEFETAKVMSGSVHRRGL